MSTPAPRTRESRALISRVPYLPGLDGMRALAVVAVMVYHANSDWLHGGFLGVEVFFVISGYLITLLLIAEHEKDGSVSLRQFWLRRFRRLLPALFAMMLAVAAYTALFNRDELGKLRGDVIGGVFYGSNWYQIWIGAGYTAVNDFAPLRHLWSLAVEEQFYVFWPLVMIAFLGLGRRRLPTIGLWLMGTSVLIAVVTALIYHPGSIGTCETTPAAFYEVAGRCIDKSNLLYLSTPSRMSGILLGAGMAMWWRPMAIARSPLGRRGTPFDVLAALGVVGLGVLMWSVHFLTSVVDVGNVADAKLFRGGFFFTAVATCLVIAAVTHPRTITSKLMGNPAFLWVGTRSYGLYLYHWPIYQAIRKEAGKQLTPLQFVIAMVLTVAITEASFRYLETPIRKGAIGRGLRGLGARTEEAADRRRKYLAAGLIGAILPVFAGVQLATAELKQNDVQQAIDEGGEFTTDILDQIGGDSSPPTGSEVPTTDTSPTSEPGGTNDNSSPPSTKKPPKTTTTTTEVPKDKIDVFALGDSVMLGAAENLTGLGAVVDAKVSRQGSEGRDILQQVSNAGLLGNVVVIHLGTNGSISESTFADMIAATKGIQLVVVLTLRADRSWVPGNNAIISALPAKYPTVKVLDWATLSNACPGDCFASDNIHLNADGRRYYAQLIWEAIGRA